MRLRLPAACAVMAACVMCGPALAQYHGRPGGPGGEGRPFPPPGARLPPRVLPASPMMWVRDGGAQPDSAPDPASCLRAAGLRAGDQVLAVQAFSGEGREGCRVKIVTREGDVRVLLITGP